MVPLITICKIINGEASIDQIASAVVQKFETQQHLIHGIPPQMSILSARNGENRHLASIQSVAYPKQMLPLRSENS